MAAIDLVDLRKVYPGGVEAVKGVSLAIGTGELIVLVGPSGCGKSTLLRMVAGLETITSGTVSIEGREVNRLEPAERDIAMVFQNYALYPHMKVYDNMAYGLRNRGTPKAEIETRVREAARILEIENLLERKPRQLSGGQRQRVAMGRAIVRKPKAFLFDEPLSNLDAKLRGQMRIEIKNLQRSLGVTSIYVTHDQVEAMTLADTLVVMNQGVAEQIGTPLAIYEKPASTFVASFIGSPAMNLLAGEAAGDGTIRLAGGQTLKTGADIEAEPGRPVLFGIRPEHLRMAHEETPHLEIVVKAVEALGADTMAHGVLPGSDGKGADKHLIARFSGGERLAEGDRIPLVVEPERVSLFDAASGRRL